MKIIVGGIFKDYPEGLRLSALIEKENVETPEYVTAALYPAAAGGGCSGSPQAMEAIKYFTGAGTLLTGALLTYDALTQEFHKIRLPRRASCAGLWDATDDCGAL